MANDTCMQYAAVSAIIDRVVNMKYSLLLAFRANCRWTDCSGFAEDYRERVLELQALNVKVDAMLPR